MPFPLPALWILGFKGNIGWNDRSHTLLVPVAHRRPVVVVVVAVATEVSGVGGAPQGVVGTEMSGARVSRSTASYLPSSLNSTCPPNNWRQVENEAELACS
jgi:hypothetical protein